jgi:hypothetical protein
VSLSPSNQLMGWVRGRAIGVSGFSDEAESDPARLIHDGAHRWVLIGRVPVARLPTGTPAEVGANTHAFEIVLKGSISEGMTIHAALVALCAAHGGIAAADIAWPARSRTISE